MYLCCEKYQNVSYVVAFSLVDPYQMAMMGERVWYFSDQFVSLNKGLWLVGGPNLSVRDLHSQPQMFAILRSPVQ